MASARRFICEIPMVMAWSFTGIDHESSGRVLLMANSR